MIAQLLADIEECGITYVDTMEQAGAIVDAASERWPATTERYGWDCRAAYDDGQKRWRFQIACLAPLGLPED